MSSTLSRADRERVRTDRAEAREALRRHWRATGWYADLTLAEALADGARHHPDDRIVFEQVDGPSAAVRLDELHAGACDLAGRLFGAGLRPGDTVIVQTPTDAASTEALVALWTLGAVVVPVVTTATPVEVAGIARETAAAAMFVAPMWRDIDLAAPAAEHGREWGLRHVFVLGDDAPDGALAVAALSDAGLPDIARPAPSSPACIIYTSGSTASPKGVQHSHETLLAGSGFSPPAAADVRSLMSFPAGHVAAVLGLLRPLTAGGTTVVVDRWSARVAAALIEQYGITASAGTPFYLQTLLDEAERSGRDISTLARFLVGAATVRPALVARAEAAGIVSWRTYGSTEQPAISSGGPDDPPEKRRLTDGRVAPGNEVRLVDADGVDVAPGAEGEIVARGPRQFLGYRDTSLDDDAFLGSWLRTGDLARFDEDGYLVVTDRVKDIIIRGGENISAREVEDALAEHPAVQEAAVCAAPDPTWGEVVCAFVIPRDGAAPTLDELRDHVQRRGLAGHKAPAKIVLVDDFPRTAAGKVRKRDLKAALSA